MLEITERTAGDVVVLVLKGRMVLEGGELALKAHVDRLVQEGRRKIVLDLRGVSYIDSAGLGMLVAKYASVRRNGGDVRLVHVTERSNRLLSITKLVTVFRMFESEAEAVASFNGN
jgi:anti-sigma B factor antagonist